MAKNGEPTVVGVAGVHDEHDVQLRLVDAFVAALASGDRKAAAALLQQLDDLTDVHFASEQVLMRLHSYDGYREHEGEHGELLSQLRVVRDQLASAGPADLARQAWSIRQWLTAHINSSDRAFLQYLRESPRAVTER